MFWTPTMGAFSLLGFQDAGLAHSVTHFVAISTPNHNNLTSWQCSQIFPKTVVKYIADSVKTFAEFRHCIFPPKACILPHCVVEDNGNLGQYFWAVSLLVLLCSSERAFHSEP